MIGHGGHNSCGYCMHSGDPIKSSKNAKSVIRYVRRLKEDTLRTHRGFLETYNRLRCTPIDGIKAISSMIALNDFDLVNGWSIDYMHCILLGVTKKLMTLWLDSKNHKEKYYIQPKNQVILSNRIKSIRPTFEITRKPRSIFERENFKANEYRSFLLYYLRYSLNGLLEKCYIDNFQLLSSAVYTLLLEKISFEEISIVESKLKHFTDEYENLYGRHNVTINTHLLRHIGTAVRNLGPLWAQSAFGFETNNGHLVKTTSKKGILHNLTWKYCTRSYLMSTTNNHNKLSNDSNVSLGGKKKNSLEFRRGKCSKTYFSRLKQINFYSF